MLSWEEFEEKEVKPVKAETQAKQAQPAPQPQAEQVELPKVALQTGSLSDRLERAKKAVADFDKQTGEEALEGMGSVSYTHLTLPTKRIV